MKVYAIKLKYMGNDENGFVKYIWATEEQKQIIETMRNNIDQRHNFVEIGGISFAPIDVAYIELKNKSKYDLPKYVVERIEADEKKKITSTCNENILSLANENA